MEPTKEIESRVGEAASLPDLLAATFDALEMIRMLARASEDCTPGLFAAFMATADAAVDAREPITISPSLPPGPGGALSFTSPAAQRAELEEVLTALGKLGVRPDGYRSPGWELTPETLDLLGELGFSYDASLMADDRPYWVTSGNV